MDSGLERVTVAEAARRIGITPDAVRKRFDRGDLQGERDERGRIHVYVAPRERPETEQIGVDSQSATESLIDELRRHNRYLEEENRRKDHLLAAALERIPAIEPAPEQAEPEPVAEESPTRSWLYRFFFGPDA